MGTPWSHANQLVVEAAAADYYNGRQGVCQPGANYPPSFVANYNYWPLSGRQRAHKGPFMLGLPAGKGPIGARRHCGGVEENGSTPR